MRCIVTGARGVGLELLASRAGQARRRSQRWLLLGAAWAMAACTLTSESYEPHAVERLDAELGSGGLEPPLEPSENEAPGPALTPTQTSSEEAIGPTRLAPSEAENAPAAGSSSGGREPSATDVDAPVDAEPGEAVGGVEAADAGAPASTPEELPAPAEPSCATLSFGGSCYEAFAELVTWDVAEQRCVAWGGHLASVETTAEDTFLDAWPASLGIASGDGSGVWLGGTDAAQDGVFRWQDGSAVSSAAWAGTQPDNGAGLDCIEKRNDGTGLWYDLRCSDQHGYVCERPL